MPPEPDLSHPALIVQLLIILFMTGWATYKTAVRIERMRWHKAINTRIDWLLTEKLSWGDFPYAVLDLVYWSNLHKWGSETVNADSAIEHVRKNGL